jgi:serine/alanine adding enzyme
MGAVSGGARIDLGTEVVRMRWCKIELRFSGCEEEFRSDGKIDIRINDTVSEFGMPADARWPRLAAHESGWSQALRDGLSHQSFDLTAHDGGGRVVGWLPLTLVKSLFFGKFLVSQPYLNSGGVWTAEASAAKALIDRAVALSDELQVKHLELRHEVRVEHDRLTKQRDDKVHMRLELPGNAEALMKSFKSKLRSQVKKSFENPFSVHWGRTELLSEFYFLFARNMRDLGTPVYSASLFESILGAFPGTSELCVVRLGSKPVAGALLLHNRGITEVPSASSLREFNATGANMWMYWQLLQRAIERGSETFDFGRSSLESGTFKFKEQWGAVPHPAVWQYYVRSGAPEDMRPTSPKRQRLIQAWQKLPVWVTRWVGPSIVRGIP